MKLNSQKSGKLLLVFSLLVIVVLISSCRAPVELAGQQNYKTGTDELEVNLLNNQRNLDPRESGFPVISRQPSDIYEGSQFVVAVDLHNQAAYDTKDGKVTITGLDPKYFDLVDVTKTFPNLQGRQLINPAGDRHLLEFPGNSGFLPIAQDEREVPFSVDVTYNSTMEYAETFCIHKSLYNVYDDGCEFEQEKSTAGGQGSPLVVEKVETRITPGANYELEFRATLDNHGAGQVKAISIKQAKLANEEIDCHFLRAGLNNKIIGPPAKDQEVFLRCQKPVIERQSSYSTVLALEFEFQYQVSDNWRLKLVR